MSEKSATKRWLLRGTLAALILSVLTVGARAITRPQEPAKTESAATALEFDASDLARSEVRDLPLALPLTGTLRPINEAVVKAKVAGELRALSVREGDTVRAGQAIGRIDAADARSQLAEREADAEAAGAQLEVAEKNRATQQALLERHFISRNAFDTTLGNFDVARARLKSAQAAAQTARKALRDTALVAPIAGVVAARHAQAGERVAIDGRIVTIVDLSRLELTASLPAADIGQVRTGQALRFRVEGFGEREFAGRIERINPVAASGSRSIEVYAVIENADGALRGGMFAQGRLEVGRIGGATVVPASAVREERGEHFVYALESGRVVRRVVKILAQADGWARIGEGLAPGIDVVRLNLGTLREGAPARVRQAAAR